MIVKHHSFLSARARWKYSYIICVIYSFALHIFFLNVTYCLFSSVHLLFFCVWLFGKPVSGTQIPANTNWCYLWMPEWTNYRMRDSRQDKCSVMNTKSMYIYYVLWFNSSTVPHASHTWVNNFSLNKSSSNTMVLFSRIVWSITKWLTDACCRVLKALY